MQQMGNRMTNAIQPARDNAQVAAGMVGVDVSNSNDNCYDACFPKLTFQERVYGCVGCFAIGLAVSFLGFMMWWTGKIAMFATLYTLGNIISICGSGFLFGPRRQLRNMTRAKRRIAVAVYVGTMLLTLVVAFTVKGTGAGMLILICVFCQWCALIWYMASYIPYGQKMITKVLGKAIDF